ncbi:hotdog fold domain-containing protein [Enemella sp. A6]|uniref:hotdog fold domain-containing protein n=1 Tax=Enemella sp. A6 TaxID=3440152 RepID=UPI003EBAF527
MSNPELQPGLTVTHKRYVGHRDTFFLGGMVDGSFLMGLFGQVAAEICIRTDGDEGQFVGYSEVDFTAPVHPGDVLEIEGKLIRIGNTSREMQFEARVLCRSRARLEDDPQIRSTAAKVLDEPLVAARAIGTAVVPVERQKKYWPQSDGGERWPSWGRRRRDEPMDPAAEIE